MVRIRDDGGAAGVEGGPATQTRPGGRRWLRAGVSRPAVRHLVILACYLLAGVAVTWPRAAYLVQGRLPDYLDVTSYTWDLWWVAHQVTHLGNPFFTRQMAAPAGVQLGFDTLIPLPGLVLTPVTLIFGPSASLSLLTIVVPGLACYTMYRAARLWLRSQAGAIAAGACFGLCSMADWQDWYHIQLTTGMVLLPVTLEAAVRVRRCWPGGDDPPGPPRVPSARAGLAGRRRWHRCWPGGDDPPGPPRVPSARAGLAGRRRWHRAAPGGSGATTSRHTRASTVRPAAVLGLALGACVLINQEIAVMALILAALTLVPWLAAEPAQALARLRPLALGALVAAAVASPQLIAMAQQLAAGGAAVSPRLLASSDASYGTGLGQLFAPSPRLASFGLPAFSSYGPVGEGMPGYGVVLTVLAAAGLAARWRRGSAWRLAGLWLGCSALALGVTLYVGSREYIPLRATWNGVPVSWLMPYTWLIQIPGLASFRDAARLALLGLVGAALLAGSAVEWLREHVRAPARLMPRLRAVPAVAAITGVAVLGIGEAGWSGSPGPGTMPTALPALDRPIAADHSGSIVLDIPYGLRGGLPLYGSRLANAALLIATADGHPRAISYTAWVPPPTIAAIARHPFYAQLVRAEDGAALAPQAGPAGAQVTAAQLAAARQDLRALGIGWALVWQPVSPAVTSYLAATGFRPDYRADGVAVYRPTGPLARIARQPAQRGGPAADPPRS